MVTGDYDVGSATVETLNKDIEIILDFAEGEDCPVPMLSIAAAFLRSAAAQGWHDQDPAVVKEVLSSMAGLGTALGARKERSGD
jgi:3-hydroxyisobutyrate dehydrogenase-like beta-hydroxyacid dehydrogenase